ncbi:amidohydrolase [Corynebacterium lowii]|uniref:Putative hydrolase YxeP n=1 Tax=Corynebacterium lowii TaxID=1544413 RepID=A0A0Q0UM60_9CORY|nr:amidohydrolase [Corynebacterium lowii]KQB87510.1 putative hydrolase YxeP [Corynebacterium lowii]MDP9851895.1 amidohydrolase [Corynebacterium lowii]
MRLADHVRAWLTAHRDEVISWRRHLHAHPELSHEEHSTTAFLAEVLREHGLEPRLLPGTGLTVDVGAQDASIPRLAFRADIDALPVREVTGLPFSSTAAGVSHACGHDVHTTIALALACALAEVASKSESGEQVPPVRVIFQPAEEVLAGGASEVIAAGALDGVGAIYALHVEPKLPVGKVGLRSGAITSATDLLTIDVTGPGGHSSRPHLSADVVYGLSKLVTDLPGLLSRRVDPRTGTVLVFGSIKAGDAPNAIPQAGRLSGTLRTADMGVWRTAQPLIEQLVTQVLAPTGCAHRLDYLRGVPPVLNDAAATAILAEGATHLDPQAVTEAPQSSGGEDFSWYLQKTSGAMARLGCWSGEGNPQDLHQGDLRVDERAVDMGVRLFAEVVQRHRFGEG